jgi:5-oxoprolinase (ATP-hydrolysing)
MFFKRLKKVIPSVPMEFLELYYPLRIEAYHTVPDSGGPGLYRGGNAQRIRYRFLEEGEISVHDDRWLSKPWGVVGGELGARERKVLYRYSKAKGKGEEAEGEVLPSKLDHVFVSAGDVLEWKTWGGGGYGDPLTRDPEIVALEVACGLVTAEGAKTGYGVVVMEPCEANSGIHSVHVPATEGLRKKMGDVAAADGRRMERRYSTEVARGKN